MAKAKPQNYLIGGLMYVLLFAAGEEKIGGRDSDDKCGGEERWEQKVMADPEAADIPESYQTKTSAE